jgi:hypothetical protein
MTLDELKTLDDGLAKLGERFLNLPEHGENANEIYLQFWIVRSVVKELYKNLENGVDPYEALCNTALGNTPMDESKVTLLKILMAKPEK